MILLKIAIISDLHLGFRQYGALERENDFYNQFYKVCNEINKHNPDVVIIAGDLFDKPNPSPVAINTYREGIGSLNAEIVCAIQGNHTMILRDNHFSIDDFFGTEELEGYYLLKDSSLDVHYAIYEMFSENRIFDSDFLNNTILIDGITYRSNSNIDEFIDVQKKMAQRLSDNTYNILVVHQSFKEFCGFTGEKLSIEDIDYTPYDVIICGHIHSRFNTILSDGTKFIQPGSIERMNTTEAFDEQKNKKGFYLLDTKENSLEFYPVECERKFFLGDITINSEEDLENHLRDLKESVSKLKEGPIISYNYKNYCKNINSIREKIDLKTENILLNKSNIDDLSEEEIVLELQENGIPTVVESIKMYIEKTDMTDDECALAIDLYEELNNNPENVPVLLDNYFKKHKKEEEQKEEIIDIDEDLREIIEYFGE